MQQDNSLVICCLWLTRLAWINLCWWMMIIAGLFVSGIAPASVVAMQMIRRYLQGKKRVYFSEFVSEWKNEWLRSNLILLPLLILVLGCYWVFSLINHNQISDWLVILMLSALPLAVAITLFMVAVLLELSIWSCSVKQGWINGVLLFQQHPGVVIITALSSSLILALCLLKPICGVFFLFSPVALISMICMMKIRPHLFEEHK